MPAGDAQRTWFPEMVETLRARLYPATPFPRLIELREQLDALLQSIRSERHIVPPLMYCSRCKTRHRAAAPRVSVRALILALPRFAICSPDDARDLEKSWKRYRESEQLNLYGDPVVAPPPRTAHRAFHETGDPSRGCSTDAPRRS